MVKNVVTNWWLCKGGGDSNLIPDEMEVKVYEERLRLLIVDKNNSNIKLMVVAVSRIWPFQTAAF